MQTEPNTGQDSPHLDTLLNLLDKLPHVRTSSDILHISQTIQHQPILHHFKIPHTLLTEASHRLLGWKLHKKQIFHPSDKLFTVLVIQGKMCQLTDGEIIECQKKARKKGEFVESITYKNCRCVNPYEFLASNPFDQTRYLHYALEDSVMVGFELQDWVRLVRTCLDSTTEIILRNNTFFSQFSRLETSQLILSSQVRQATNGTCIYRAGQPPQNVYFIISGTVELEPAHGSDRSTRKSQHVSTLHQMTLFGEVEYLKGGMRVMTANVISSSASIMIIKASSIDRVIKQKGERSESFKAKLYEDYVVFKDSWRDNKLRQLNKFANFSQHVEIEKKQPAVTRNQKKNQLRRILSKFLHASNQVEETLKNQNSILEMHCKYTEKSEPISFSNRLFQRADFPELQTSLRRYENEEKRIKKKLILPRI